MEQSKKYLAEEIYKTLSSGSHKMNKMMLKSIVRNASNLRNMSLSQLNVMSFLESHEYVKMKDIGKELGIKPSSVTNLVDRLINSGLILRSHAPDDRRVIEVHLSEKGKALNEEFRKNNNKYWEKILKKIDETEYDEILRVVKKLNDILSDLI